MTASILPGDFTPDPILCNATHQYLCQDKKKCIPTSWVCNNDTECDDGSDERGCAFASLPPDSNNVSRF
jgi:hypothetical protein